MNYIAIGIGGVAVGIAAGLIIYKIIEQSKTVRQEDSSKILENCFGSPMYASTFSISEVKDWLKNREDLINNGSKAVILKANAQTLKNIGKDLDIGDGAEKNLIIAITDEVNKAVKDSVLVKYDKLDEKLESALNAGNGILVVEA